MSHGATTCSPRTTRFDRISLRHERRFEQIAAPSMKRSVRTFWRPSVASAGPARQRDARREYVYEAKKRLYTAVAPTMFQLTELRHALQGVTCLNDPGQREAFQIVEMQRRSVL